MSEEVMTHEAEVINYLTNLKCDIGKAKYQELWHYEEAIDEAIKIIAQIHAKKVIPIDQVDVDKAIQFIEKYSFEDKERIYTNGSILVPLFRVKQSLVDKAYNGFLEG